MDPFAYQELFPEEVEDKTEYRRLTDGPVAAADINGRPGLEVKPEALTLLAAQAFKDVNHLLRASQHRQWAAIVADPAGTDNDRYIALEMLKNAQIAAEGEYPLCQDTGTAIVIGKKGHLVATDGTDAEDLARGVHRAYTENNFRYSQNAALSMYEEVNTGTNLPAQIDLYAGHGDEYHFLFIAKGGGSANKTVLFQETRETLSPGCLVPFLTEKIKALGTAACPPYHLAIAIGGLSAELTLKTVKLASAGALDHLPDRGDPGGHAFRDLALEAELLAAAQKLGIGAQFGGKHFCLDVRVIRLPRHGASCPIGLGVSCSADRNVKGKITREGVFVEELEQNPAQYIPTVSMPRSESVTVDLDRPMDEIRALLGRHPIGTRLMLRGQIVVARDIAHARLKARLDQGQDPPQYFKDHVVYYAGPAKTPKGRASGAFGPTTAGRMDAYVPRFQAKGASLVMLAKGNRSQVVTDSCKKYGGFYLGSIGGAAARLGRDCITASELIEFPELGMEAIYLITVNHFPAFIVVNDKGENFFGRF